MHQIVVSSHEKFASTSRKPARRLLNAAIALLGAATLALLPSTATAACGSFGGLNATGPVHLPMMDAANPLSDSSQWNRGIVGLWHVVYTNSADGSMFNNTLDLWHSDGTEFESAFLAPAGGNVCVGVWKQSGPRTVTLRHVGWIFDPSNPTANATNVFTLDEVNTVSRDGRKYSGTFTFKVWNLDGTFAGQEVKGTIAATRISVQ